MKNGKEKPLKPPALFLFFHRPETTLRVFERIREQRPWYLYVGGSRPRRGVGDDAEKCRQPHETLNRVDWKYEVKTLFRELNLGCRNNMAQTISWFFRNHFGRGLSAGSVVFLLLRRQAGHAYRRSQSSGWNQTWCRIILFFAGIAHLRLGIRKYYNVDIRSMVVYGRKRFSTFTSWGCLPPN